MQLMLILLQRVLIHHSICWEKMPLHLLHKHYREGEKIYGNWRPVVFLSCSRALLFHPLALTSSWGTMKILMYLFWLVKHSVELKHLNSGIDWKLSVKIMWQPSINKIYTYVITNYHHSAFSFLPRDFIIGFLWLFNVFFLVYMIFFFLPMHFV